MDLAHCSNGFVSDSVGMKFVICVIVMFHKYPNNSKIETTRVVSKSQTKFIITAFVYNAFVIGI